MRWCILIIFGFCVVWFAAIVWQGKIYSMLCSFIFCAALEKVGELRFCLFKLFCDHHGRWKYKVRYNCMFEMV